MSCIQSAWIWCKRFRHRKGYGVHSPFAFNLITWVIYEKMPYYVFSELKTKRKEHLKECRHFLPDKVYRTEKTDKLLFRLVNHIQPSTLLEIGTCSGLSTLYMSAVGKSIRCISVDNVNDMNKFASRLLGDIENVQLRVGDISQSLPDIVDSLQKIDFLHLNYSYVNDDILEVCLSKVHSYSIMVIEGIHDSKEMQKWWNRVIDDDRIGITFDLYSIGIIFFDKMKIKQHYVVNF